MPSSYVPPLITPQVTIVAIALGLLLLIAAVLAIKAKARRLPYFSRGFLLSKGELAFFCVLRRAVPSGLMIAPKVRLGDLIGCSAAGWKAGYGGRISQKHVDFVLVDATTTAIILMIELDDRSHQRTDRRDRDLFVDRAAAAANIPILHIPAARTYDAQAVRRAVAQQLAAGVRSSASSSNAQVPNQAGV